MTYDPDHIRGSVVVVPILQGHMAMLRRGPTDPWMPGKWNFPGGGIEPRESPRQAASRELAEESGFLVPPSALSYIMTMHGWNFRVHVFSVQAPSPFVTFPDGEHSEYTWTRPDMISRLSTIPLAPEIASAVGRAMG